MDAPVVTRWLHGNASIARLRGGAADAVHLCDSVHVAVWSVPLVVAGSEHGMRHLDMTVGLRPDLSE